ncbi:MAG: transposase [Desulfobacterales bacterium]|nr:transposase [Desulfobacterales bacterium]
MARPLRIVFPGAFYHVTSRGNERKAVFKSKRDREKFFEYLETATERYHAVIHAFCLMDNHYHLLLETPSANLPQIMRHINGAYTTYFNVKRDRSGHLFQGRYKAILVEKDEYAKELSRYIHLNPVRAKMVKSPEEYVWSSYNFYIGKKNPPKWLNRDFILSYFGKNVSEAQRGYQKFVTALVDIEYKSPLTAVTGSVLLGTEDFVAFIREKYLSGQKPDRNLPAIGQLVSATGVTMEMVCNTVAASVHEDPVLLRNVQIYLCRKHTREKLKTIGNRFGISDAGVSQVVKRLKTKVESDRKLGKQVEKIERKLRPGLSDC